MSHRIKWPEAEIARVFIRPVVGMSEEVQTRMINRAVEKLGIEQRVYRSPLAGDKNNERGSLLRDCNRGDEVVIVARLNCLARSRVEVKTSVTIDFALYISALLRKCQYILVLDDNMGKYQSVTSNDDDWDEVVERAIFVATNGRKMTSEKGKELASKRWAGQFRGVVQEWTENPERAKELEDMARIWRDPQYKNAKLAYAALPEEVRKQIKSVVTANRIFGKRKPNNKNLGRKKKVNGPPESPVAIYDIVENGAVVYTGMTENPYRRMQTHLSTGLASNDSHMEIIDWFGCRSDAYAAESLRINMFLPPKNVLQNKNRIVQSLDRYGCF